MDRLTRKLLRKALTIRESEVPTYRVLDILATRDGDISEVINRYTDIKEPHLRTALHYCASLLKELAKQEGFLPAWEQEGGGERIAPQGRENKGASQTSAPAKSTQRKSLLERKDLVPFVDESVRGQVEVAKAHIDGASRGNPGPASIGVALFTMEGKKIAQIARTIGETTNNVAEYSALLEALKVASSLGIRQLHILCDSELLVNQMNGTYKIKNESLRHLAEEAHKLMRKFARVSLNYVSRENNKLADSLTNYALDLLEADKQKGKTGL